MLNIKVRTNVTESIISRNVLSNVIPSNYQSNNTQVLSGEYSLISFPVKYKRW